MVYKTLGPTFIVIGTQKLAMTGGPNLVWMENYQLAKQQ
jgi:hypothetical protein